MTDGWDVELAIITRDDVVSMWMRIRSFDSEESAEAWRQTRAYPRQYRVRDMRRFGVWCIDEACFYDPTPRDWNSAQTEAAMLCNTNRFHRFEAQALPSSPLQAGQR